MNKTSYNVALGGITSSLCILMMFLTGVFPLLALAIPIYAGVLLITVAKETDFRWAFLSYGAVSLLSLFVTPDKEAAIMFIMFFGYYPLLHMYLMKMKNKPLMWLIKFAVFNVSIVSAYYLIISVFALYNLIDEFGFLGDHLVLKLMIFANVIFIFYDFTVSMIIAAYEKWFRPTYLKRR